MVEFSPEVFDAVCGHIADGKSLRAIGKIDGMPSMTSVMRWLSEKPELREQYARAREEQAHGYADEIVAIADDAEADFAGGEDGPRFNSEHVQRSKLRIDARKWVASKLLPKVYGDRAALDHTSSDGSMTPKAALDVSGLSDAALAEIMGAVDAAGPRDD